MRHPPAVHDPPPTATSHRLRANNETPSARGASKPRSAPRATLADRPPPPDTQMPMDSDASSADAVAASERSSGGRFAARPSSGENRPLSAGRSTGATSGPTTSTDSATRLHANSSHITHVTDTNARVSPVAGWRLPTIVRASTFCTAPAAVASMAMRGATRHRATIRRRSGAHRSSPARIRRGTTSSHDRRNRLSTHSAARASDRPARTTVAAKRSGVPASDRC